MSSKNDFSFRIQEKKLEEKWLWSPQFRVGNESWQPCVNQKGETGYFSTYSAARHWLFWEDGSDRYPQAGDGKKSHQVFAFDRNGKRVDILDTVDAQNRYGAKPSMEDDRRYELFVCDCGDVSHQFIVSTDNFGGETNVYVEVKLNRYLPFWRRFANAFRYLFKIGTPSRFGDYDCVILNKSHIEGLQRVIETLKRAAEQ